MYITESIMAPRSSSRIYILLQEEHRISESVSGAKL